MKDKRGTFFSNYQTGAFNEPQMYMTQPSGYTLNQSYQGFGPNQIVGQMPYNTQNTTYGNTYIDEYDERLNKIERQIRKLDTRLKKLEGLSTEDITDDNIYMI